MNFRISFILVVLLVIVGGYVLFFELRRQPGESTEPPWIYNIGYEDMVSISVTHQGQAQAFINTREGWVFKDTGQPVDPQRWGGVILLLSGPRTARELKEPVADPAVYGLEPPESHIAVTIKDGRQLGLFLGKKTPDGASHYAQVEGSPSLFLITSSWGDVITRLATEPPAIATPTPEAA